MTTDRRHDAEWYEQELKRHELAAARRLTGVLPADQAPRPNQLAQAGRVMERALKDLGRLRSNLEGEIERLQGRGRGTAAPRRVHPEVPRYIAARNAIDEVVERWERRRDQLTSAAGKRPARPRR